MTTTPQAVTERYVSNLIHYGRNKEFDITHVTLKENVVEGVIVGYYFSVFIQQGNTAPMHNAVGATIAQAVRNCLIKYGVTFR